jgi:hypothetical protein
MKSPFAKHKDYFFEPEVTAELLALMVLSMYNSTYFHFPLARMKEFGCKDQEIANELIAHFLVYGENDLDFVHIGYELATAYMKGEILHRVKRADGVKRWKK